jgi:UDP-3-O-[3-hydroxymyristoyl] glucosamine N-acyltransferase
MNLKVSDIANFLNLTYVGNGEKIIKKLSSLDSCDSDSIVFIEKIENIKNEIKPGCVISKNDERIIRMFDSVILSDNPKLSFSKLLAFVEKDNQMSYAPYVSESSHISSSAKISPTAFIGNFVTVEDGAEIMDDAVIESGCYIGKNSRIGKRTRIYPGVVIRENVFVGKGCIIHSNSVIGSDGFGYVFDQGKHMKVPQAGGVIIGDDVEIGASVAIDRATIDFTVIGNGTKIDNLVHIAHNVKIGNNCLILAQVGISGSTVIEDGVIIAGQAGLSDHIRIKAGTIVMPQSGVIGNLEGNRVVFGTPARNRGEFMRIQAAMTKLPEMYKYFMKKIKNEG